ncbi:MAG: hypothetical protein M3O34_03825 [Chloroflexota bacterium]|nr:hypothetical protein [Chloroflexota bacterium]
MAQGHAITRMARVSRRAALRAGAVTGAAGVGLTLGSRGATFGTSSALAQPSAWRPEHLEVEFTPTSVSMVRAGSGPPQRGDWFYADGPIYAIGDVGGTVIGTYQCFGAWTHASTETDAPDQRLTSVQFRFEDGAILGIINEGGVDQPALVGAIQGGTGRFTGALGTFRQVGQAAGVVVAQPSVRGVFDLLLPNLGGQAAPWPAPAQVGP